MPSRENRGTPHFPHGISHKRCSDYEKFDDAYDFEYNGYVFPNESVRDSEMFYDYWDPYNPRLNNFGTRFNTQNHTAHDKLYTFNRTQGNGFMNTDHNKCTQRTHSSFTRLSSPDLLCLHENKNFPLQINSFRLDTKQQSNNDFHASECKQEVCFSICDSIKRNEHSDYASIIEDLIVQCNEKDVFEVSDKLFITPLDTETHFEVVEKFAEKTELLTVVEEFKIVNELSLQALEILQVDLGKNAITAELCDNVQQSQNLRRVPIIVEDKTDLFVKERNDLPGETNFEEIKHPTVASSTIPFSSSANSLTIPGKICREQFSFLIDTGANVEKVWRRLPQLTKHPPVGFPTNGIISVSGELLQSEGKFTVPFEIESKMYPFHALVIEGLNFDVIIGKDFLNYYKFKIDFRENVLYLGTRSGLLAISNQKKNVKFVLFKFRMNKFYRQILNQLYQRH